jgi:hypothetical protein
MALLPASKKAYVTRLWFLFFSLIFTGIIVMAAVRFPAPVLHEAPTSDGSMLELEEAEL